MWNFKLGKNRKDNENKNDTEIRKDTVIPDYPASNLHNEEEEPPCMTIYNGPPVSSVNKTARKQTIQDGASMLMVYHAPEYYEVKNRGIVSLLTPPIKLARKLNGRKTLHMGTISRDFPIPKESCMKMSPLHCDISYDENKDLFIVTDLCSEQGTYSNRPIKQIKDYFVVGKKAITLHAKPSDAALAKELGDRFPIYVKVYVSPGTILTLGGVQILLWSSENPDEDELAEQFGIPEEL